MTIPTDPQHAKSKEHIVEVALKAFYEQGIRNVTMDDIAHSLTMSKRTLYQIFADKEELLLACVEHHVKEERERLINFYNKDQNVLNLLLALFDIKLQQMEEVSLCFVEDLGKYPRVKAFFEKDRKEREAEAVAFLNLGIEEGLFREGVNFHIVYSQLMQGFDHLIESGLLTQYSQREIFVNTIVPYVRGCATIKGIEIIDSYMQRICQRL